MNWRGIACLFIALAIVLGAFGAHGLKNILDQYHLDVYEKAVQYHFLNALGLLILAVSLQGAQTSGLSVACTLILVGIIIFSGSLYLLAVTDLRWLGAITPIGGVLMILGWAAAGISFYRA